MILRDNTGSKLLMKIMNHIFMPLANLAGYGDVKGYLLPEVREMCEKAGLVIEKLEAQKGYRLHLVARKK